MDSFQLVAAGLIWGKGFRHTWELFALGLHLSYIYLENNVPTMSTKNKSGFLDES